MATSVATSGATSVATSGAGARPVDAASASAASTAFRVSRSIVRSTSIAAVRTSSNSRASGAARKSNERRLRMISSLFRVLKYASAARARSASANVRSYSSMRGVPAACFGPARRVVASPACRCNSYSASRQACATLSEKCAVVGMIATACARSSASFGSP